MAEARILFCGLPSGMIARDEGLKPAAEFPLSLVCCLD